MGGSIIASVCAIVIVFFMILGRFFDSGGAYIGILIYFILPVPLIIGLILIPIGMIRRSRKIRRGGETGKRYHCLLPVFRHSFFETPGI